MRKSVLLIVSCLFVLAAVTLAFAGKGPSGKFSAKAGDVIYACGCGAGCDCGTLGNKEGKCGCGQDMVKATVTKVENNKVYYKIGDNEFSAPNQGKYACGCGKGCNCGYIAQKPGKCGCGEDMVKVKTAPAKKK